MSRSQVTAEKNPCHAESALSMKCLSDNGYDKSKCEAAFENYKGCRQFWQSVKTARNKAGVRPGVPNAEEQPVFKAHFLKTGKIPVRIEECVS